MILLIEHLNFSHSLKFLNLKLSLACLDSNDSIGSKTIHKINFYKQTKIWQKLLIFAELNKKTNSIF